MPPVEKRRIIRSPKLGLVEITFMSNVTGPLGDPPNVPYRKVDPKDVAEGEIEDRGAAL
jgi:hypothetical protein